MDRAVTGDITVGVFGKLPARGDFVREGLPRSFTDPWDDWWQCGLAGLQEHPGWVSAWLEAPVWRFALPPGLCGPHGMLGMWLPSVDKAGRYFPLTVAAAAPFDWAARLGGMALFLEGAEQAGRDALEHDLPPDAVARAAAAALAACSLDGAPGRAGWWTEGGPRVAPRAAAALLPKGAAFAAMIDDAMNGVATTESAMTGEAMAGDAMIDEGWSAAPRASVAERAGDAEPFA